MLTPLLLVGVAQSIIEVLLDILLVLDFLLFSLDPEFAEVLHVVLVVSLGGQFVDFPHLVVHLALLVAIHGWRPNLAPSLGRGIL